MTWIRAFNKKANTSLIALVELIASVVFFILDQFQSSLHNLFQALFPIVGIKVNGPYAWDIQIKDKRFYALFLAKCTTGLAESYCNGYIDCENLEELFLKVLSVPYLPFIIYYHPYEVSKSVIHRWFDVQTEDNTCNTVGTHYDKQSEATYKDLFQNSAQYSGVYFPVSELPEFSTVNEVDQYYQEGAFRMRELIASKLKLKPGMRVLDIGCGFGALAKHLAEKYGVHVTGVTISHDMAEHAAKLCKGLDVEIHCKDYRKIKGNFDRITCVEMFCHLGEHHYREFFEHVNDWLTEDGLLFMQTVSVNHRFVPSYASVFETHVHFYAHLSRPEEIVKHSTGLFIIEDWRNYGYQYGLTCQLLGKKFRMIWNENIEKFDEYSNRKLMVYGALMSASARSRKMQLYHIVFSKNGVKYDYNY